MLIESKTISDEVNENPGKLIADSEKNITEQLSQIADSIIPLHDEKPFILISGPSGSGKTTSAVKLSQIIKDRGCNVIYISMDKYFRNFTDRQRELKMMGKIDLESPDRVDKEYLYKDLESLFYNREIDIPKYDFETNIRKLTGKKLSRKHGFVIVEGIHALNPDVLSYDDYSTRIYVSVRTRVRDSQGDVLHPSKIRLLRRMARDEQYRGRSPEETIKLFPEVQRGENRYILPYKYRATYDIDTFLAYEPCIFCGRFFDSLSALSKQYADVRDIVQALDTIPSIDESLIPDDALAREFIGGSSLSY